MKLVCVSQTMKFPNSTDELNYAETCEIAYARKLNWRMHKLKLQLAPIYHSAHFEIAMLLFYSTIERAYEREII